jgi:hypothetical protein
VGFSSSIKESLKMKAGKFHSFLSKTNETININDTIQHAVFVYRSDSKSITQELVAVMRMKVTTTGAGL